MGSVELTISLWSDSCADMAITLYTLIDLRQANLKTLRNEVKKRCDIENFASM